MSKLTEAAEMAQGLEERHNLAEEQHKSDADSLQRRIDSLSKQAEKSQENVTSLRNELLAGMWLPGTIGLNSKEGANPTYPINPTHPIKGPNSDSGKMWPRLKLPPKFCVDLMVVNYSVLIYDPIDLLNAL